MKALLINSTLVGLCFFVLNCGSKQSDVSYWGDLKKGFATRNEQSFEITSHLEKSYKSFKKIRNPLIDSILFGATKNLKEPYFPGDVYLYSLEKRHPGFTEFTVLLDEDEHGKSILYLIFDKNNKLCSKTQLAYMGGEGGIEYKTRSKFVAKDTLLQIISATTWYDFTNHGSNMPPRLNKSIGDSTFNHLIFQQNGKVLEERIAEKKELKKPQE